VVSCCDHGDEHPCYINYGAFLDQFLSRRNVTCFSSPVTSLDSPWSLSQVVKRLGLGDNHLSHLVARV
jgi:hypothetical protein